MSTSKRFLPVMVLVFAVWLLSGCTSNTPATSPPTTAPIAAPASTDAPPEPTADPAPTAAPTAVPTLEATPAEIFAFTPVSLEECQILQVAATQAINATFLLVERTPFSVPQTGETGEACLLIVSGTGADFSDPFTVTTVLMSAFPDWVEEMSFQADGPTGNVRALARGNQVLVITSGWTPSADANCPPDQPITACDLAPEQKLYTIQIQAAQKAGPAPVGVYNPVSLDVCTTLQELASEALSITFIMEMETPFTDIATGETGQACTLTAIGNGTNFSDPFTAMQNLRTAFQGWIEQPIYQADGPTGTATAMTRDMGLMLVSVSWEPSPDADCPTDQPISACDLAPEQKIYTVIIQAAQK